MSEFASRVAADFAPGACLDRFFAETYSYRPEQQSLAGLIADGLSGRGLLLEAETGIGKTMAYLVPALRCKQKILISTHTKGLQDQLMHRDLPQMRRALGIDREVCLLKGRASYLCPQRMHRYQQDHRLNTNVQSGLARVAEWALQSPDGDLSALDLDVAESGLRGMITATAEQCLGRECPSWESCPLVRARLRAQRADIVIANHSLLLSDAALKAGAFGEVLPEFDAYILDEAHSLPELASQHFGLRVGRQRFITWTNDMLAVLEALGDEGELKKVVSTTTASLLHAYGREGLDAVQPEWFKLIEIADSRRQRSEEMVKLAERAEAMMVEIKSILQPAKGYVAWREGDGEQRQYVLAPVETGLVLASHLWSRPSAFILLSATLRVSGSFEYAMKRLGLEDVKTSFHASPFNYSEQALVYLPRHLPTPGHPQSEVAILDEIIQLLLASSGRAFVLFTSHRMLQRLAPLMAEQLPWPVLEQGRDGSRDRILQAFRENNHSILCGTRSFWEGVDVPGETLSMVIIDKLPFAPPDNPLLRARIRVCEEGGGNGFADIQLPEAIAILRQGLGRLIRSATDRGVMAILDARIHTRNYGREVIKNLPPAPVVHDLQAVRSFYIRPHKEESVVDVVETHCSGS